MFAGNEKESNAPQNKQFLLDEAECFDDDDDSYNYDDTGSNVSDTAANSSNAQIPWP
jgi:hypothetical protein